MLQIKSFNCDLNILIDEEDLLFILTHGDKWRVAFNKNGTVNGVYGYSKIYKKNVILSRILVKNLPKNYQVDHIDRNPLNNQKYNLRIATHLQNQGNRGPNSNRKYKGIRRKVGCKFYHVVINYFDAKSNTTKRYYKGSFKTQQEAALHANEKFREFNGEFAYQNQIS